jgi:two-component system, NtrC family, response regulator
MAKLLIVDDEKNIRLISLRISKDSDTGCAQLKAGGRRYHCSEEPGFDLVLTDYLMAEMDGYQLLQRLKAQDPDIPVILMSAYATVEHAIAAMK